MGTTDFSGLTESSEFSESYLELKKSSGSDEITPQNSEEEIRVIGSESSVILETLPDIYSNVSIEEKTASTSHPKSILKPLPINKKKESTDASCQVLLKIL